MVRELRESSRAAHRSMVNTYRYTRVPSLAGKIEEARLESGCWRRRGGISYSILAENESPFPPRPSLHAAACANPTSGSRRREMKFPSESLDHHRSFSLLPSAFSPALHFIRQSMTMKLQAGKGGEGGNSFRLLFFYHRTLPNVENILTGGRQSLLNFFIARALRGYIPATYFFTRVILRISRYKLCLG